MLARGTDAGEISPRLGPDATMDALVGPIVYCALTGSSVPRTLVDTLSRTSSGLAPPDTGARPHKRTTIFPWVCPCSDSRCASAISSNGYVAAT